MKLKTLFKTGYITVEENESTRDIVVSEWMQAGQILAALEDEPDDASGGGKGKRYELVAGEWCDGSADKKSVLSSKPGYPSLIRLEGKEIDRITVNLEPIITISDDGWTVRLRLYPPFSGRRPPTEAEILEMLAAENISWGIRQSRIKDLLNTVEQEKRPVSDEIIVRGRLPVNGEDARLKVNVSVGAVAGKQDSSGTIDYRERNIFIAVEKGQLVATKVGATTGIPGVNIFGHEVPQSPGKDLSFNPGPDVEFNQKTGEVFAAVSGVVSSVSNGVVKITDKLSVSGDVDYNTGNLNCRGALEVSGAVMPGFKVSAGGDLMIAGNVESATVDGKTNVVLRGGLIGKKSLVTAAGNVDILYSESGTIKCGGTVMIRKEAYFCTICSGGDINTEENAAVIGSKLISGGSLNLATVDTDSSPLSVLAAAVDNDRYEKYFELRTELEELEKKVRRRRHRLGPGGSDEKLEDLEEELEEVREEFDCFNLVPVSKEDDRAGGLRYACKQKIVVKGELQSGVVIRIGNFKKRIEKKVSNGYFKLIGDTEEIIFCSEKTPGTPSVLGGTGGTL